MEYWQIFGSFFLIFAALYVYSSFAERAKIKNEARALISSGALATARDMTTMTMNNTLQNWDEKEISLALHRLQNQPPLLVHYVEAVKQRFVERQNAKTAAARIGFLEKQIGILQLANQYADLQNELSLKKQRYENDAIRINLENQTLRLGFKDEPTEQQLRDAENERRILEKELEIARLKRELDAINNPPPKQLSREEAREKKREEIKAKIQKINEMITETRNDFHIGESERQAKLNQYERKKFDLNEELMDLI